MILASPDLDIDVFRRQVREMGESRPLITVFVSRNDHALRLSALLAGGIERVGAVDLTEPQNVAALELAPGVVVLDLWPEDERPPQSQQIRHEPGGCAAARRSPHCRTGA